MSLQVVNIRKRRLHESSCLFCDEPDNLVQKPKPQSFENIQKAADRRKDHISETIKNNIDFTEQNCSWHRTCMASYISEEKIRRREIALQKQENMPMSTPSAVEASVSGTELVRKSSRASLKFEKDSKCLICGKQTRNKNKFSSEISAAEQILNTVRKKQDDVFTKISTCVHPVYLFVLEVRYHKHCYRDYLRLPSNSENPAGRPSKKIPHEILVEAFEKMIHEIEHQLTSHSFEMSLLAQRVAELTEIEDAVVETCTLKSLLIDKYGEKVYFLIQAIDQNHRWLL
ncbi:hypothetical protein HHI36_010750 [Cryptolaemus montrouzieri]|uniref:Uncharacterized protein n=1 Tax=Cryptolaemus montrouzieri TaxID=559131 RepID=A0ABD2MJL9_9CUCU